MRLGYQARNTNDWQWWYGYLDWRHENQFDPSYSQKLEIWQLEELAFNCGEMLEFSAVVEG